MQNSDRAFYANTTLTALRQIRIVVSTTAGELKKIWIPRYPFMDEDAMGKVVPV
jgi:hypothetical protein